MSHGMRRALGSDEMEKFGFASILDWFESVLDSFPAPWKMEPLNGKYYGTVISDARDIKILSFWESGPPSQREKDKCNGSWSEESLAEYNCDWHYESELAFAYASMLIANRNARYAWWDSRDLLKEIFVRARWEESIWSDIVCGGPDRRSLT